MPESSADRRQPAVSIILPTYNRARFLPQALESIRAQEWTDWELILVDDGSTDDTRELLPELTAEIEQPVRYIAQENQGPYGARNTGLDHAQGRYIAFFDSDDEWLPHHLKDCVEALEANPELDWVYGASQIVDHATGRELVSNTFYPNGKPQPFLRLRVKSVGGLRIITDPRALRMAFLKGMPSGLQNSVIRSTLFSSDRFRVEYRHECEDRLFLLRALAEKKRVGYFERPHLIYRIHDENSSGSSTTVDVQKQLDILSALVRGRERLKSECRLSWLENWALNCRISSELFWAIGYALLWQHGRHMEALRYFRRAMLLCPWNVRYWKTYVVSVARLRLGT